MTDQRGLGMTFDSAADLYQQARTEYPEHLYEAMIAAARLGADDRLLEVGCASGKATLPLARRGFRITCVEPGPALAAAARRNLASFPASGSSRARSRTSTPRARAVRSGVRGHRLALARSSGSLPAHVGVAAAGRPRGVLGCHARLSGGRGQILRGPAGGLRRDRRRPARGGDVPPAGRVADQREDIEGSGLFEPVLVRHFDWEVTYDADGYIGLLDTFSGHIAMEPWQRRRLYSEIRRRLDERADGLLRRGWGAVLHVARRRDLPHGP